MLSKVLSLDMGESATIKSVKTLIFCDFETNGLFQSDNSRAFKKKAETTTLPPSELAAQLKNSCVNTQELNDPRILELCFTAVSRDNFMKSMKKMAQIDQTTESLWVDVPCQNYTRQINPELTETEWSQYEDKKRNAPNIFLLDKDDLIKRETLKAEWLQLRQFLDSCPKPACLISHNGLSFDFRLLYSELRRCNLLENKAIPYGILYADTLIAIPNIENSLKQRLQLAFAKNVGANNHPLRLLERKEWPVALFKRLDGNDFEQSSSGVWKFVPKKKSNTQTKLYETIVGRNGSFHRAQADCEALLQITLSYSEEFLKYLDSSAAEIFF